MLSRVTTLGIDVVLYAWHHGLLLCTATNRMCRKYLSNFNSDEAVLILIAHLHCRAQQNPANSKPHHAWRDLIVG